MKKVIVLIAVVACFALADGNPAYYYDNEGNVTDWVDTYRSPVTGRIKLSSYQVLKQKNLKLTEQKLNCEIAVLELKDRVQELKHREPIIKEVEVEKEVLPWWTIPLFILALVL